MAPANLESIFVKFEFNMACLILMPGFREVGVRDPFPISQIIGNAFVISIAVVVASSSTDGWLTIYHDSSSIPTGYI